MNRILTTLALLALAACGDTTGREVPFSMRLSSAADARRFTTATGWEVTLEEAKVVVGAVYLFENPPPIAARAPSLLERVGGIFIAPAWAHAGDAHFFGGQCLGEWLDQLAFDALAQEPVALGALVGNAGRVRSFSLLLDAPRGALAREGGPTKRHHAWLRGTATKDGSAVPFEGGLDLPQTARTRYVDGISADFQLDSHGAFTVLVDARAWLDGARFETLAESGSSEVKRITPTTQVHSAWFLGLRSARTYAGSWVAGSKQGD